MKAKTKRKAKPRRINWRARFAAQLAYETARRDHANGDEHVFWRGKGPQSFRNMPFEAIGYKGPVAFFDCPDIIVAGTVSESWQMYGFRHDRHTMIACGCRWFTVDEAKDYWLKRTGRCYAYSRPGPVYWRDRAETRAALKWIIAEAKKRGWRL